MGRAGPPGADPDGRVGGGCAGDSFQNEWGAENRRRGGSAEIESEANIILTASVAIWCFCEKKRIGWG
jgi:hypothetical protein